MFALDISFSEDYAFVFSNKSELSGSLCFSNKYVVGFVSFPVREHLNIDVSVGRFPFNINISVPELKTVRISLDRTIFYSHQIYNLFIDAPKLEKLYVKEDSLSNFNLKNTQSLVEADINIYLHHSNYDKPVAAAAYAAAHAARAACATEFLA